MATPVTVPKLHGAFKIELLVNNVVQEEFTITHVHLSDEQMVRTFAQAGKIRVKKEDHILVKVTVLPNADNIKQQYRVMQQGTSLCIEKVKVW